MRLSLKLAATSIILLTLNSTSVVSLNNAEMFASFWKTFKTAVARNDKDAVADITKLPFLFDSRPRDRAGFIKIYDKLFTRKVRRCVATARLQREQENYEIFCGELIFLFGKDTDGKYKLLEFGVND